MTITYNSLSSVYIWKNRANLKWKHDLTENKIELRVDESVSYYSSDWKISRVTNAGIFGPGNEFYTKINWFWLFNTSVTLLEASSFIIERNNNDCIEALTAYLAQQACNHTSEIFSRHCYKTVSWMLISFTFFINCSLFVQKFITLYITRFSIIYIIIFDKNIQSLSCILF